MLAFLAAACGSDSTGPQAVASVQVSPATFQVQAGASAALTAILRDASGNELTGRAITWTSGNGAVATVSTTGAVSGVSPGTTTITATSDGVAGTASVTVIPGPATQMAFTVAPGSAVAGVAFTPAPQVTVRDAIGNTATDFAGPVTLALAANPGGAALSGPITVSAVAGVATFPGVSFDKSGVGYTLQASAGGLTAVTTPFAVTAAAATHLVFSVQPGTTAAGETIAPAIQVTARDAFGNTATGFTGAVTIAIGTNPSGGTLSGTTTVNAVSGVAIFGSLSIDRNGGGYTLGAGASGLTGATSNAFDVTVGAATAIALVSGNAQTDTVGKTLPLPYVVRVTDAGGNGVSGVTVAWAVAGNGTITPSSVTDAAGHAQATRTLGGIAGTQGTTASVAGLAGSPVSFTATAVAGAASQLAFTVQPSTTTAGAPISPAVQVTARDGFGNTVPTFTGAVALAIGANPPGTGVLDGTTGVAAVGGVATFSGINIDEAGAGYTVIASATGLTGATSTAFTITPGAATQLAFTVQPSSTVAGAPMTPAVQVTARDALGNTATGFTGMVTVAIGTNPPPGGALDGATSIAAVAGIATFPGLDIDEAGTGYTLTASAAGFSTATSTAFDITAGGPTQLAFTVQPGTTAAGAAIAPAVQVTARDALGNTVTSFTASVTLAIGTNPPGSGVLDGTTTVAAVAGVASFPGVNIDEAGAGYTLTASSGALTSGPSNAFSITAGAATQLAFTVQPVTTSAGAPITPAVQVTARDALGNTATAFTGTITVAIGTNPPPGGALDGTTSVAAVAGVATFAALDVDEAGAGYTLTAAATGLTGTTSAAFSITPGPAIQLAFTVQPVTTAAGAPITPAVQVTARDALGNTATAFTGIITVAIGTNPPPGGALDGATSITAVAGVASFPDLNIDEVGAGYTLTAGATGLTSATSAAFSIIAGGPALLAFTVQPGNAAAGAPFAPVVQVTARDALGNTATGFAGTITLAIGTNPPSIGVLDGNASVAAVAGVANFPGLNIDEAGVGYTLIASATGLTGATSAAFTITPGPATQLAFTVQPSNAAAGVVIAPAVQVTARDGFGNTAPTFTGSVSVAIGTNPPGTGVLDGTASIAAVAGVATFAALDIDEAGAGYTLTAAATGLTGATSAAFTVTPGPATQLAFTVQPGNTTAGAPFTPAVQVTARDALGNTATTFTSNVTLAIANNPPGNGVLDGTATVAAAAGVASFPGINIDEVGAGYTLTASAAGLTGATSGVFNITVGAATQLAFTVQPSNEVAGTAITPIVQVTARDAVGNTATGFTGNVTLAIGTNPPGTGALDGTVTVAAVAGIASFPGVNIDEAGTGYTLTAAATGLTGALSVTFNITAGSATQLAFTVQPVNTAAGAPITPTVQVTARDSVGNTATSFTANVTLAIGTNPPGNGVLDGTATVAAVAGIASFPGIDIDEVGAGYTFTAGAAGLTGATSSAFNITSGAATQLAFTVQPADEAAGAPFTPAVQVTARDALGNVATGFTGTVTVAIGTNPPPGGVLDGTTSVSAVLGVATFPGLNIDKAGTGYTLTASATGLTGATSAAFTIAAGAATQLAFTVQPSTEAAGAPITPAVQVTARDAFGNTAPSFTGSVTLAIGTNPPGTGVLDGTTSVAAIAGVATFAALDIDEAGAGYTLTANATGLTGATSAAFNITAGAATQLAFTVQPGNAASGAPITPAVQVTARDALGNTATGFTGTVTVAIGTNPPPGGVLDGTASVAAVAGVASFPGLNIDEAGTGYTLTASAPGLTGATSAAFTITAGAATQLAFTVLPSTTLAGASIVPVVQVTARDALGNTVTSFSGTVTLAIGTNPPGNGILDGTTSVVAALGVANFPGINIDEAGAGYTLTASATGLTGATSSAFTITPRAAAQLVFSVQPSNAVANAAITPAVQVTARDSLGNTATAFTGTVTLAIAANPGNGALDGDSTINAVAGVATFPGLNIDEAGVGYTLTANAAGVTDTTSNAFTITAGAATQLAFTVQPSNAGAGVTITPAVQVTARDAFGNTATSFTGAGSTVTVAIGTNPASGALSGTTTVAAAAGVAIFPDLSINNSGSGYTLTAAATGLTGATSTSFSIGGGATQLAFTVQPSDEVAGVAIAPAVQVTARDAMNNTVTGFTGNITISIAVNPGGSTLSGTTTVAAVSGVATFSNLSLDRSASGYTLQATAPGLATATSTAFAIAPAAATGLVFAVEPTTVAAGTNITPSVRVRVVDAFGNTAGDPRRDIVVALANNPAGATLSGNLTRQTGNINQADSGVAVFNNLSLDKVGVGYTLSATTAGLTSATSAAFDVTPGAASQLAFTVQPSATAAGAAITPAIQVTAHDASGNTATGFTGTVTLAIGTNPPGNGALDGTVSVAAVAGVATFTGVNIDEAGVGYTLTASAGGLTGATSTAFTISAGAATQLAFTVQPTNANAGAAITPAVQVTARDALGNTAATFTGTVTLAIGTNPPGSGVLDGTASVAAVAGVATFPGLNIDEAGGGYTLTASAGGLTGATSAAFNILGSGVSATLSTLSVATDSIGQCLAPCTLGFDASRVTVTARDQFGNPVAGAAVTLSAASSDSVVFANPGASGVTDASGVFQADFSSGQATAKILSAVAAGAPLAGTDTVHVMPVLVGAGDIADCNRLGDDATANQLDGIPGIVYATGDLAYPNGRTEDFANCYDPTWGRHKARTRPTPGNHEYDDSPTAAPYFTYFGANAGTAPNGYYSYDVGTWHVVVLNDNVSMTANSAQVQWLRADLNGRTGQCVLAYWHRPRFSSGPAGPTTGTQALWQALADSGVEIALWGHDHAYERFAPMNGAGSPSPTGVRAWVIGTGGGESLVSGFPNLQPNSEVRDNTSRGVLRFTLYDGRYRWEFMPAAGFGTFTDSGSTNCN